MPRILPVLACPADGSKLSWNSDDRTFISSNGRRYGFLDGIASFFVPNDGQEVEGDVTEIVKAFYERTPFPNYNDVDDRRALRQKAAASAFAKLLDEQLPESAKVFEAGCGTGQLSNFLGMRPGRVCIGGDMIVFLCLSLAIHRSRRWPAICLCLLRHHSGVLAAVVNCPPLVP